MTKTAIRRMFFASIPAALIASTSFVDAASIAPATHPILRTTVLARPFGRPFISNIRNANGTPRTTFVAGGATLPAIAYLGAPALTQNPGLPATGSILGEFANLTGVTTQYCQTGSGFGKKVFNGDPSTAGVNGTCAPLGTTPGSTNGFGAPAALALTDPDITGSDAPLSQSEYSQFVTAKAATRGEPVELPSIIGAVALLYNNPDLTTQVSLTDPQICSIADGHINNWNQINKAYKSRALFFVYRSDGSGTTFSFSNHLLAVCKGLNPALNTSQNFTNAVAPNVNVYPGTLPLNFVGQSGNVGVAGYIKSTAGAIGYTEAANAQAEIGGSVAFAKVNGHDPIKDLPQTAATLKYTAATIAIDSAVVTTGGPATVAALTGVAKAGCVNIVKPASYANVLSGGGYTIIAVTNVLFSTLGNGATNASHLQTFVNELNTPSLFGSSITTVNAPTRTAGTGTTGFAALGSTFNGPLPRIAKTCIGA